jgi:hypothetical protein
MPKREWPHRHFPICIIEDRYWGTYSGGEWLAIGNASAAHDGITRLQSVTSAGPSGDDDVAMQFWTNPPDWIAAADTPDKALKKLHAQRPNQSPQD